MNKHSGLRWLGLSSLAASLLIVAGCSLAPTYERPAVNTPEAFKETAPSLQTKDATATDGAPAWKVGQPSEAISRGEWWAVFDDAQLNDLERKALDANQSLKAAAARLQESRSIQQTVRAGVFPTIGAGFGPTREKLSPASQFEPDNASVPSQTLWRAQASASYEVDLFGRVSDSVRAATADAQQSEALLRSVQLALQADVAQNYFNLRELDAELDVYTQTVKLREQALTLVQHRYDEGEISELDVARAKSELATAQSDEMSVHRSRAASEHSLAVLLGQAPETFSIASSPLSAVDV